ncbi:L-lactate permease [Paracoccus aminophilus]|uniref:L-lactate permease n=1 Tax=Paracoccus aminophilus JCM 7686 TaxID=1367847 RepID=S5Y283_PARAH|nr:L-lactate permease [Paracoccus aminophilus]AGT09865.1 L-lactate permease [Paracoccus aminophilus JCM 7686]
MSILLSLLPILLPILALLAGIRSLYAALSGIATALIIMLTAFPHAGTELWPALARWLPVMSEVLLIVGGGLLLSETLRLNGAQAALADWIAARTGHGVQAVLLVVHGVTPFAESVTGFGIGVTIGIPLLIRLGLAPRRAAMIGLLGLCAVPWGSMAPGTLIAANMSGLTLRDLGLASAVLSVVPFTITGMIAAWLVQPSGRAVLQGLVSGLVLTLAVTLANAVFGTAPAGAVGAVAVIALHLLATRRADSPLAPMGRRGLRAYGLLLGGVLVAGGLLALTGQSGALHYAASPALWLFVAALWFCRGLPPEAARALAWRAFGKVAPVTAAFLFLGVLMSVSGMAALLAEGLSGAGKAYLPASPFVAAAGGFITGSNTGANAMLAATQAGIARALGVDLLWFMAIHNVAASFLLMASPGKIEMAVQLAGAPEARAEVQRFALKVAAAVVACLALLSTLQAVL